MLKTDITKRVYGLDILRAIAILTVLNAHSSFLYPEPIASFLHQISLHGVTIFFVLSGFLIGQILIKTLTKEKTTFKSISKFWGNRWLRTIPPYYTTLIIIYIIQYVFHYDVGLVQLSLWEKISYFLFLQNIDKWCMSFFIESWSLSVEEWFYLTSPIIIVCFNKICKFNIKKSFFAAIVFIILTITFIRIYRTIHEGYVIYQVITHLDSIMFGMLGAFLIHYYNETWNKGKKKYFLIGCVLFITNTIIEGFCLENFTIQTKWLYQGFAYTIVSFSVLLLLPYMSQYRKSKGFFYKTITFTSLTSYSIYLLNYLIVMKVLLPNFSFIHKNNLFLQIVMFWALVVGLSTLMYLFIEKPCMDIRKKIKFLQK